MPSGLTPHQLHAAPPKDALTPRPRAREMLLAILVSEEEEEGEEEMPLQAHKCARDSEASRSGQAQGSETFNELATTMDAPNAKLVVKQAWVSMARGKA